MTAAFDLSKLIGSSQMGTVDWTSGGSKGNTQPFRLDNITHGLIEIPVEHVKIHAGESHLAVASTLADDTEVLRVLFKSPSTTGNALDATERRKEHMVINAESALASTVRFYKNSTVPFGTGTVLPEFNRNFHAFAATPSYYSSAMSICTGATGAETSTKVIGPIFIGSASVSGKTDVGGGIGGRHEFILEPDDWYLVEIVSRADNNALTIILDWYSQAEQTDIT